MEKHFPQSVYVTILTAFSVLSFSLLLLHQCGLRIFQRIILGKTNIQASKQTIAVLFLSSCERPAKVVPSYIKTYVIISASECGSQGHGFESTSPEKVDCSTRVAYHRGLGLVASGLPPLCTSHVRLSLSLCLSTWSSSSVSWQPLTRYILLYYQLCR